MTSNCTTMAMDALEYAYGKEKFTYGGGALWIPHVVVMVFKSLYDSGAGIVKNAVTMMNN